MDPEKVCVEQHGSSTINSTEQQGSQQQDNPERRVTLPAVRKTPEVGFFPQCRNQQLVNRVKSFWLYAHSINHPRRGFCGKQDDILLCFRTKTEIKAILLKTVKAAANNTQPT